MLNLQSLYDFLNVLGLEANAVVQVISIEVTDSP